ncbi:MAG TPA: 2-isopropylmalate synthase [Labilithrix sp.]|nr:2-isopropylmalate synthase [Labilithrix sp.]
MSAASSRNGESEPATAAGRAIELHDETLRDGTQSTYIREPSVSERLELLARMAEVGIESANIAIPATSARHLAEATHVCREVASARLPLVLTCAARTMSADVSAVIEVSQRSGVALEAAIFVGSSPIRGAIEGWDVSWLCERTAEAVDLARRHQLAVCFVTEDTTRTPPERLEPLFKTALDHGASRLCLCDTVGHATPDGVRALVDFVRRFVRAGGYEGIALDWHGHNDRGLALANSLAAARAGVDRVHGTAFGLGERAGNAPMDLLIANLRPDVLDANRSAFDRYRAVSARVMDAPWCHTEWRHEG